MEITDDHSRKGTSRRAFLSASAVGAVAAIGVTALCYTRFKGLKLDERPAEPETVSAGAAAEPRTT